MSKVNNITKCIIPCLNNIFNEQLKHVSNAWYLDNNQNLYKIMLYEDGYLISSDSEYPEEIDELPNDNIFKSIKIYLDKVNRREYVSNKESIFKFSFVIIGLLCWVEYFFPDFKFASHYLSILFSSGNAFLGVISFSAMFGCLACGLLWFPSYLWSIIKVFKK